MREIDAKNAAAYLREKGFVSREEALEICELSGGVSNIVLLVTRVSGERFVVKQARPQLRVPQPWFCNVERVLREIQVLRICGQVLHSAPLEAMTTSAFVPEVPRILFEDRENYLYAMTAAPEPHTTWKQRLMAGVVESEIAVACGELLATLHGRTWLEPSVAGEIDDRQFFDDLRLDPYYRQVAKVNTSLAPAIDSLIDSVWTHRRCLVHGDFSPKNLLVWNQGLMLIDFEVGHYGDPAFDLGFFVTHLALKTIHHCKREVEYLGLIEAFTETYRSRLSTYVPRLELASLECRAVQNWAGCMLARVDGKSRVDYSLNEELVRAIATSVLKKPSAAWCFNSIKNIMRSLL